MVMGRRYKWPWDGKVVKGDEEALNGNEEALNGNGDSLNANGEALKGDKKASKDKEKNKGRSRSIEGQWEALKVFQNVKWLWGSVEGPWGGSSSSPFNAFPSSFNVSWLRFNTFPSFCGFHVRDSLSLNGSHPDIFQKRIAQSQNYIKGR